VSFGALAAWQAWLLLAGAGAAAGWLFYRKVRPPRVAVPTLLLWRRVLDTPREMTWWERIRRTVSLGATVLVAVFLALAVTRPGPAVEAGSRGRVLIVLDSSWSMLTELPGGGTRWDRAVERARRLAAAAGGDAVAIATTAGGLVEGPTADLALIETALGALKPSGGEDAAWPRIVGAEATYFLTDGSVERALDASVEIHSVYEPAPNVAVTAFQVRRAAMPSGQHEAYLEIANYADRTQPVRVAVSRGTEAISDTSVSMAPGEAIRQVLVLGPGEPRLRVRVSAEHNALAADDEAVAWFEGARPIKVTVVSAEPGALGLLLQRHAAVEASYVAPGRYAPDDADVLVLDGWVPADAPGKPALVLSPPTTSWLGRRLAEERDLRWSDRGAHPVLAGVDPQTLAVARAAGFEGPGLVPVAASESGTPLVLVADEPGRRLVVLNVAFEGSNLAFSPAFPVLVADAIGWLARPEVQSSGRPGVVELPASTTRLTAPDGTPVALVEAGDRAVARLDEPGLYLADIGGGHAVLSANVGGPDVSNVSQTSLTDEAVAAGAEALGAGRIWWLYAVAAAFVLLAAEWWTWQRRITV